MLSLGECNNYYSTWYTRQYVRIPVNIFWRLVR